MINITSLRHFLKIVGHFGLYPAANRPVNIQGKHIMCVQSRPSIRPWFKNILKSNLFQVFFSNIKSVILCPQKQPCV